MKSLIQILFLFMVLLVFSCTNPSPKADKAKRENQTNSTQKHPDQPQNASYLALTTKDIQFLLKPQLESLTKHPVAQKKPSKTLKVKPVRNLSTSLTDFSRIPMMIEAHILETGSFRILQNEDDILQEATKAEEKTPLENAEFRGADYILMGTFREKISNDPKTRVAEYELEFKLIETVSGQIMWISQHSIRKEIKN